ncbi:hypothetical protein [Nocardia macrotermitis]|uniref:hypothetical protein n=1 Tax=Nocardia macrotermitis TaxID=2585198 RepID=UPI001296E3ED|nr:hypothetical protein [Nocardia macrotermitis]
MGDVGGDEASGCDQAVFGLCFDRAGRGRAFQVFLHDEVGAIDRHDRQSVMVDYWNVEHGILQISMGALDFPATETNKVVLQTHW